jgi:hypothetical protein
LPEQLGVQQNDHASNSPLVVHLYTFDKPTLELVMLADASTKAYEMFMGLFRENLAVIARYN